MALLSQTESQDDIKIFESQIRECFGRVVYSHKTHEKCAEICLKKLSRIKFYQILLSALTSGSFLINLAGYIDAITNGEIISFIGAIASSILGIILLGLNLYTKNYDLGQTVQKHKDTADKLWNIRESYLSLLTDIVANAISVGEIISKRDQLQKELAFVYTGAPRTNGKAYKEAQTALKKYEDMTFSDAEIDAFLPTPLHKINKS